MIPRCNHYQMKIINYLCALNLSKIQNVYNYWDNSSQEKYFAAFVRPLPDTLIYIWEKMAQFNLNALECFPNQRELSFPSGSVTPKPGYFTLHQIPPFTSDGF